MKRKVLSLLLALITVLSLVPVGAAAEELPFDLSSGYVSGFEKNGYTFTDWEGTVRVFDIYTVTVPEGAQSLVLGFNEDRIAYGYDADGNYICSCGSTGDGSYADNGQTGQLTATVKADGNGKLPEYVHVQTPYDSSWSSTTLYAVRFEYADYDMEKINAETRAHLSAAASKAPAGVSDWVVLGLARDGVKIDNDYYIAVANRVSEKINDAEQLDSRLSTENSRTILALTAAGRDASSIAGHDLIAGLSDFSYVKKQGLNGAVYALLALDCGAYSLPEGSTATREALIGEILGRQLPDGGWAYTGSKADADMTAVVLQALAPYYKAGDTSVKETVDKALGALSDMQTENGGFITNQSENSESCAQVIIALTALGISPDNDARFVKNGVSVLDAMCAYAVDGGEFKHIASDSEPDATATQQCYCALVAYRRFIGGSNSLYDMTDAEKIPADPFTDIYSSGYHDWIVKAANAGIINGYPDGTYRPNNSVTRAQFVTMLYRAAGAPEVKKADLKFNDVSTISKDYVTAVAWGVENGVVMGYGDNTFRPNQNISRAQMATFMYRYLNDVAEYDFGDVKPCGFADADQVAAPYVDAVNAIVSAGVMNGMNAQTFAPNGTANRGMAATVMFRAYDLVA